MIRRIKLSNRHMMHIHQIMMVYGVLPSCNNVLPCDEKGPSPLTQQMNLQWMQCAGYSLVLTQCDSNMVERLCEASIWHQVLV